MSSLLHKVNFTKPRWQVFSRVLAAVFGGYALATVASLFIAQLLIYIIEKNQAIHISIMLTFLIYAGTAMWVFAVTSARQAWVGLLKLNAILLASTWLLMQFTGVSS
ncbi:hypothetical protein A9Q74_02170 [Colwellia sp. 39_35_sub15_T18]|nr:hypothetical protein A9Q74_02170 [Colwellia sp. 39_35_sub15_T18]